MVYRIATNTALDRLRDPAFKHIAPDARPVGSDPSEFDGNVVDLAADAPSLDQQLFRQERYSCYRDFIQNLPVNYRMVVALSELEELAAKEIAEILGLSLDVVKVRLHRGRARLLSMLKDHCKPEDWL